MDTKEYISQVADIIRYYWHEISNLEAAIAFAHSIVEQENNCYMNLSRNDIDFIKDCFIQ
jgi:hypothetical protein